jgi:hypothetical protein
MKNFNPAEARAETRRALAPNRRRMPLSVKLASALHALGLDPANVDFDHDPAISLRPIDPATGDTIPPQLDPRYIVPRSRADHARKTFGDSKPLSGDVSLAAKVKRVEAKRADFRHRLLAKADPDMVATAPKRRLRAIPSRPFPKKRKPE